MSILTCNHVTLGYDPTVFGLFDNEDAAKKAYDEFRAALSDAEVFMTAFT